MAKQGFKQALFEQFAKIGKALSNANRLEILEFLAQGSKSVEQMAKTAGLSVANTSQHLQMLRRSGLVTAHKDKQRVFYELADEKVLEALFAIRVIAENNIAEVELLVTTYLKVKDDLEPVGASELLERAKDGLVTILDVRPPDEFAAGRIAGAINVPIKQLEERLKNIDTSKEIIAYCRGPYCVLAFDAVRQLRQRGFKAKRLEFGFPEWKLAGLPTDSGGG